MTGARAAAEGHRAASRRTIDFEHFAAVDMRVGRIVEVEDFPEARKPAWKLRVDFGPEIGDEALVGADHELRARGARGPARGRRRELPAAPDRPGALRGARARHVLGRGRAAAGARAERGAGRPGRLGRRRAAAGAGVAVGGSVGGGGGSVVVGRWAARGVARRLGRASGGGVVVRRRRPAASVGGRAGSVVASDSCCGRRRRRGPRGSWSCAGGRRSPRAWWRPARLLGVARPWRLVARRAAARRARRGCGDARDDARRGGRRRLRGRRPRRLARA